MVGARLVVVSNRLPVSVSQGKSGWNVRPSSGGLVQALEPVLQGRGGCWIGWPGVAAEEGDGWRGPVAAITAAAGYDLVPVPLARAEVETFYRGFANSVIWPLFHDLLDSCEFDPEYWYGYLRAIDAFADVLAEVSSPDDLVWIHDYHLIHLGDALRRRRRQASIGYFLHIPFPPLDIFLKMPWRAEILAALLGYDLVGFQTARDRRNFLTCVRQLLPGARIRGRGSTVSVERDDHVTTVGNFPIGIDARGFEEAARGGEVTKSVRHLKEGHGDRRLILGVDRLDYTKGTIPRLLAFEKVLGAHPELRETVDFVQVTVPSREAVKDYGRLRYQIERLVGHVNGRFAAPGWTPVQYHYRGQPKARLIALYRLADMAFITPVKDGMNLVAKEYCACQVDGRGVLVLSEFAGAAAQLRKGAVLVNPYDVEGMADALVRALAMDLEERRARMRTMRHNVRRYDVFWWARRFLSAAAGQALEAFPGSGEVLPRIDLP